MDLNEVKIAHYSGQKIWMVRAQGGKFLKHFRSGSIVSIEHLDKFYDHREHPTSKIPSREEIRSAILANKDYIDPESKSLTFNASGRNNFHQIDHFVNDIQKGHLIVSVDDAHIMIGVCTSSKAFFSSRAVSLPPDPQRPKSKNPPKLRQRLRKKVEWGPSIKRNTVSGLLKGTLQSRHTVTSLDEHWKEIFGLLYPFFTHKGEFYFSNRIGTKAEINGKIISRLFDNLSSAQIILKELLEKELSDEFIKRLLDDEIDWDEFDLTAKAYFMSPGGIFNKVPLPESANIKLIIRAFAVLFLIISAQIHPSEAAEQLPTPEGGSAFFTPEGLVDERLLQADGKENQTRLLGELINNNKGGLTKLRKGQKAPEIKKKLGLSIPKNDTSKLETEAGIKITKVIENEK